jgi:hypothetical protein
MTSGWDTRKIFSVLSEVKASTSFEMPSDWDFLQGCAFLQPAPAEDQCYIDYIEGLWSSKDTSSTSISTFYAKLGGYQLIIDGLRRFRIPYLV